MSGSSPIRTCVGCGARDRQAMLRRFVGGAAGLRLDGRRRAAGRGAYLHQRAECWDAFVRRRGPVRSLRQSPERAERERLVATLRASAPAEAVR